MPRDLLNLIKASGYAGTSGQSFRNNVTGAASGAKMSDYNLYAWVFGGTQPSTSPLGASYVGTTDFAMTFDFTQNSRANYIKRIGAALTIDADIPGNPGGYSASIVAQNVVAAVSGSSVTVRVVPPLGSAPSGAIVLAQPWFTSYTYPNQPPSGSGSQPVKMGVAVSSGGGGTEVRNIHFTLSYAPDIGPYNPTISQAYVNIPFTTRADTLDDFEYEWHTTSAYSDANPGTSSGVSFDSV